METFLLRWWFMSIVTLSEQRHVLRSRQRLQMRLCCRLSRNQLWIRWVNVLLHFVKRTFVNGWTGLFEACFVFNDDEIMDCVIEMNAFCIILPLKLFNMPLIETFLLRCWFMPIFTLSEQRHVLRSRHRLQMWLYCRLSRNQLWKRCVNLHLVKCN